MIETSQAWPQVRGGNAGFRFPFGLSVFFPAYNDAPSLPDLLARTFDTLRRVATDYEVIVVDDGSTDRTAEVLSRLAREYYPVLRVITHDRNRGYGGALRSGLAAANKEYIFYTDGDRCTTIHVHFVEDDMVQRGAAPLAVRPFERVCRYFGGTMDPSG